MSTYDLTFKAQSDLDSIWNYTYDHWSEKQADIYYFELIQCFQKLAQQPKLGKNYPHIHPEIKGFKIHRHVIFFRVINSEKIEITRILHVSMDLPNKSI